MRERERRKSRKSESHTHKPIKGLIAIIYKGVAKGKIIELEKPLPYPEGQLVSVSVDVFRGQFCSGSPTALRRVMHEPPHLRCKDVDKLERVTEQSKIPMRQKGVFDEEK